MESVTRDTEQTIGDVTYTFSLDMYYNPGTSELDPTEKKDNELVSWDFSGPIEAWNNRTDVGYQVSDPFEIEYVKGNIIAEDELEKALF